MRQFSQLLLARLTQYHGSGRVRDAHRMATEYDIVVTTYQASLKGGSRHVLSFPYPGSCHRQQAQRSCEPGVIPCGIGVACMPAAAPHAPAGGAKADRGSDEPPGHARAQTLGSDWRAYTKKAGGTDDRFPPLGQIQWHRVVLDVRRCL